MSEENDYPKTAPELMVRASIQILMADKEHPKPEGFGSGCIMEHRERLFLISVRHVTDYDDLTTFLETNQPHDEKGAWIQPIGGLCYFDLFNVSDASNIKDFEDLLQNGQTLDITFAEIKQNIELLQPEIDFGGFKVEAGHKAILDSRDIAVPNKQELYGFFGRIKQTYRGIYLKMENTLKHNLKYHRTDKHFHIFLASEIIYNSIEYQGCSGAPIIDSEGKLVALVCKVGVPSKMVYGFSIHECIKLLDIAIDTGML
jgi:hypothetical protein